jgi:ABC-type uncharacterized transport system permease subunit
MKISQLKILFFMLFLVAAMPLFGLDLIPPGMSNLSKDVVDIFTSDIVKGILIACLAGCAVAYGFNKDNEKMKRNIIAIAVAIAIIGSASFIVGKVFEASTR